MDEDFKSMFGGIALVAVLLMAIGGTVWFFTRSVQVVDNGIVTYESFQEMKAAADKLNTDLCGVRKLPENDKMFSQFSKSAVVFQKQTDLNRWVEEYNAKSKMINRSVWKSADLPYQLSTTNFNCY